MRFKGIVVIISKVFLKFAFLYITQVSWMRRKGSEIHLITVGLQTYSGDSRYSIEFKEPNDWQLLIQYSNERDEGTYECQVSSHPPLVYIVYLSIIGKF